MNPASSESTPELQINEAARIASTGDLDTAIKLLKPLLGNPNYRAVAHNNLGVLYNQKHEPRRGYRHFQCALRINSQYPDAIINEANSSFAKGKYLQAEKGYRQAITYNGECPKLLANYGQCLLELDRIEEAKEALEKATNLSPELITAHYNLARVYLIIGDLQRAKNLLRQITTQSPNAGAVQRVLASCTHFTPDSGELDKLKDAYKASEKRSQDRMHLAFALGKAYEDIKQPLKAFRYILIANSIGKRLQPYNAAVQKARFASNINLFSNNFYQRPVPLDTQSKQRIIFLVGLPRCGSTLVHQVLSMHPCVSASGESTALTSAILNEKGAELVSSTKALMRVRDAYLTEHAFSEGTIVDMNLYNFYWAPLIKKIFPRAVIIEITRESYGHYWSIFKNYFTHGNEFSTSIKTIHEFTSLYRAMMKHWRENLQIDIKSVVYEDLVSDPKRSIGRLLEMCDLEWNDACLYPQKSNTPVRTASVYQVRQPIYATSIKNSSMYADLISRRLRLEA